MDLQYTLTSSLISWEIPYFGYADVQKFSNALERASQISPERMSEVLKEMAATENQIGLHTIAKVHEASAAEVVENWIEAVRLYKEAVQVDPSSIQAIQGLMNAYFGLGATEQGRQIGEKLLDLVGRDDTTMNWKIAKGLSIHNNKM
jgi:hypothetical protein